MATNDPQLQQIVDLLRTATKNGNLGVGGQSTRGNPSGLTKEEMNANATRLHTAKLEQEMAKKYGSVLAGVSKQMKKFSDDMELSGHLATTSFSEAISKMNFREFEKMPVQIAKTMAAAGYKGVIKNHQDVEKLQNKRNEVEQRVREEMERTGKSFKQLAKSGYLPARKLDTLNTAFANIADEFNKLDGRLERAAASINRIKPTFVELKGTAVALSAAFQMVTQSAFRYGTEALQSLNAFFAGMNPEEMAANLAQNRQAINAAGVSMDEFRIRTEAGTMGLTAYTGELADAVRIQAQAFTMQQRFGADASFMQQQVDAFKKFNGVFSMTAEEFLEMNKQIRASSSMNEQLYRLNKKQRAQYMQETQQTVLRLRTMGLMQEQAMKVVEAMAAIGAKSPKERIKQAAKLQAVGGAMGMGAEAGEFAKLMRRGFRNQGDKERGAELQKTMQQRTGDFMGKSLGHEMMAAQMLETAGLENLLGPKSEFSALNHEQNLMTKDMKKADVKRNEFLGKILASTNMLGSLITGPVAVALAGITAAIVAGNTLGGGLLGNSLKGMIGRMLPLIASPWVIGALALAAGAAVVGSQLGKSKQDKELEKLQQIEKMRLAKEAKEILARRAVDLAQFENIQVGEKKRKVFTSGSGNWSTGNMDVRPKDIKAAKNLDEAIAGVLKQQEILRLKHELEGIEATKEQTKILEESLKEFKEMKDKMEGNSKNIADTIDKGNKDAMEQRDNIANKTEKASRVIWARDV